ncbi:MAG: endonuclease MutS2 [Lachnospiraceae bacterium]|nr:endonuclease MutS2 [Lachnospiraceae bacterium]
MNEKVLRILEFEKITDILAGYAGSEPAKNMCGRLRPSSNPEWIERAQSETEAALKRLFVNDRLSFGANKDIRGIIKDLKVGRTLSATELLNIARILECSGNIREYGTKDRTDTPSDVLEDYFLKLDPIPSLSKEIFRCIISEDEISSNASSELASIRKSYGVINGRIHTQLNSMVNSTYRTYLQDAVVTMRNNRYCLPVKTEYKNQVPGMIHDQSSTGSTIFIEPAAVVNLNNQLRELEIREQEEIERILASLSGMCAGYADEIAEDQKTLTLLDFVFAKASYALKTNATRPIFNDDRIIKLRQARHPLLDASKAIPIDVRLGEDFDLLVITGPNTGGKTVTLKTVGLLTLMGQSGLHIPALDRSMLSIFKEVYTDIGDEQSIEQSLSTFSSHMTNIVDILKRADGSCLCLFDELGAGTDPTEGAALAISILNHLHDRGVRSMATTHYSELKIYALSTDFVENASCEFDVESLRPTYRLLIGIPGKSNAFAISKKLGLPDLIIEDAKQHISKEEESFENVISDLEAQRIRIEKEQEEIISYKKEIEDLKSVIEAKQEKLEDQRDRILREAREEARDILKEAKDIADETIRAFQKQGGQMKIQTMEKKRQNVRQKIAEKDASLAVKEQAKISGQPLSEKEALPGIPVKIKSMNLTGTITVRPDSRGYVSVQCGIITSKVHVSDLLKADPEEPVKQTSSSKTSGKASKYHPQNHSNPSSGNGRMDISKVSNMSAEINVIGMTVDEAVARIDKHIDDAYLCHLPSIRIIHGKGTGALRKGIHNYLNGCPYIKTYHLAQPGEGDAGVTVVEF